MGPASSELLYQYMSDPADFAVCSKARSRREECSIVAAGSWSCELSAVLKHMPYGCMPEYCSDNDICMSSQVSSSKAS